MKGLPITFVLISILTIKSFSCVCDIKSEFKHQGDLSEYDFISFVKILRIDAVSKEFSRHPIHKIKFEIIEHFKGLLTDSILVEGGNRLLNIGRTSCDLGENIGEEWVIFAYIHQTTKNLIIRPCTRTSRYKHADGYRYKGYGDSQTIIDKLKAVFNKQIDDPSYSRRRIEYYKNGNKELEEFYKKNKLEGFRNLWFPDGSLESRQQYKNGMRHGLSVWYCAKGQLILNEKYNKGKQIDTTTYWHQIDTAKAHLKLYSKLYRISEDSAKRMHSKIQVSSRHIYNKRGEQLYFVGYDRSGIKQNETIYLPKKNKQVRRHFHVNGIVASEMYRVNNKDFGLYREWDSNGDLVKSWEYDENGIQIKESIKIGKEFQKH